jgi:hypothetical protein
MNHKFEVGEIAILVSNIPEFNGADVEITGPLEYIHAITRKGVRQEFWGHHIKSSVLQPAEWTWCAPLELLRKRKPPGEALGSWELIPWWNPYKAKETAP